MILLLLFAQLALTDVRVVDADTLRTHGVEYRLAGVDAPEAGRRAQCPTEMALSDQAADRVRTLLAGAARVVAIPDHDPAGPRRWPRDGFGRRLARIEIDGVDLGAQLVGEGLARPWRPRQPKPDWCQAVIG